MWCPNSCENGDSSSMPAVHFKPVPATAGSMLQDFAPHSVSETLFCCERVSVCGAAKPQADVSNKELAAGVTRGSQESSLSRPCWRRQNQHTVLGGDLTGPLQPQVPACQFAMSDGGGALSEARSTTSGKHGARATSRIKTQFNAKCEASSRPSHRR